MKPGFESIFDEKLAHLFVEAKVAFCECDSSSDCDSCDNCNCNCNDGRG